MAYCYSHSLQIAIGIPCKVVEITTVTANYDHHTDTLLP